MKSYLLETLSGTPPVGEPLRLALLDLIWLMPWWAPYAAIGAGILSLLCIGLERRRRHSAV